MKKQINTLVLTFKHCQSTRTTVEARPSETEAAERSEQSASVVPVEESKEAEKDFDAIKCFGRTGCCW